MDHKSALSSFETDLLVRLGIPEKAARIYLALLDLGDATVSDIAKTGRLHRAEVYQFLPLLREKLLVSEVRKGKRSYYRASDPESLEHVRNEFVERSEALFERLKARHAAKNLKAKLVHVKGVESISEIYTDALRRTPAGGQYLRYSSGRVVYERSIYSSPDYERLKKQKQISRLVIANASFRERRSANDPSRDVMVLPDDVEAFEDNISKLVYADRVAIVDHDTLEAFVIESPRFAEYEAKIFKYLWKLLKERSDWQKNSGA